MRRSDTLGGLALLLALGGCDALVTVPDSGRGLGGPRAGEAGPGAGPGAGGEGVALAAAAPGVVLPFGEVATACGAALGAPTEELAGYAIHDTAPGATAPRTHYVSGFADGCPRQVTAALAVLGDPLTHETARYGGSGRPYGPVDDAYEAIKDRVCGVRAGQPCGAAMDRLAADTAFLTLYPEFGGEAYADILFHGGEVVAADPVR
jgi:hypothetical protein